MRAVGNKNTLVKWMASGLLLLTLTGSPNAQGTGSSSSPNESLKKFLQQMDNDQTTRYISAFHDLNDDGVPEAIVYLIGKKWCGSGGCNLLILRSNGDSWELTTNIKITRPPVRVLPDKLHGWHSLVVHVQGGGIQQGYEAELRYDGKSYPKNPSVPPSRRWKTKSAKADVIIPSTSGSVLLYPVN